MLNAGGTAIDPLKLSFESSPNVESPTDAGKWRAKCLEPIFRPGSTKGFGEAPKNFRENAKIYIFIQ